ncbi:MAG: ribbon-helix-helix protein, CopG family [Deltaproteobacteria bacterium]|nr:ribbon-helix-helix protein, CopG family [Deltaproteobacteria bacterium]
MKKFRVTLDIPEKLYEELEKAVEEGYASTKSEFIRKAIEKLLEKEVKENE